MSDKIEDAVVNVYNQAITHAILILEAEYERMKLMSKSDTYCSGRIKHLIDSLEKLKSSK